MTKINDLKQDHKNARKRTDRSASLIQESLEKYETPYYIQVVKEELSKVGEMFSFPTEKAIVQTMTEPNDQN